MKPLTFLGSSRNDLRAFPETARRTAGQQLDRLQRGLEPNDWKPMPSIGSGVQETRVHDEAGAFRVIYIARRPEAVYVLHAFQKKTNRTAKRDLAVVQARLATLLGSRQ